MDMPLAPPIHKPHWKWLIIWYFFLGGLSAGSYVVATVAELFGHADDRIVVRVGRYLAAILVIPCPILLILDLGRPERFLNMFRVLKLRSPMSLGTWVLLAFGGFTSLSAVIEASRDLMVGDAASLLRALPSRMLGAVGSPAGFFVGGYTGVLLGATAVPIWAKNARLLGPLFLSSAIAASCGLISLVLACLPGRRAGSLERLHRAEQTAALVEAGLLVAMEINSSRLARPLRSGRLGALHLAGSVGVGMLGPIVVHEVGSRLGVPPRLTAITSGVCSLIGGFVMKYAVVMAGHASADDPVATFEFAGGQAPAAPAPFSPSN
jgi:formate-dependent nitrite reductase membrane component NrfD